MKRTSTTLIAILLASATMTLANAQENDTKTESKIRIKKTQQPGKKTASIQLKRIQRTPSGKVDATNLTKQLEADKRKAGKFRSPKLSEMANNKKPSTKLHSSSTTKRFGQRFESPKISSSQRKSIELKRIQRSPSGKLNATNLTKQLAQQKRHAGKFRSPKLSEMANSKKPSTKLNSSSTTKRFAGKFDSLKTSNTANRKRPSTKLNSSSTTKRFAGRFESPKSLTGQPKTTTLTQNKMSQSKSKLNGKKIGKGLGALAVAGTGKKAYDDIKKAREDYKNGKISKSEYKKAQKQNVTNTAGELYKLKKLNPTALVLNDVVGTDPISLGVDAVGDLINGTDNAKQSLKDVKKSWNKSLTKQVFTDPKTAGDRVKNGAKKFGNKVKEGSKKVGDFFKDKIKSKKKKKKRK